MAHTFLWHDYETFGVNPRRDRPSQFAAIRTDESLNEIGEPVMMYCQPAPDFLPDPVACLLTGITPQTCLAQGIPEYQFAEKIERLLAEPNTIGLGYNTIRFDDEVTRHLFWRNLIDPYAREWQNGCGRWDILDLVRTAYALRPEGIEWPTHQEGELAEGEANKPSFKLEHLSAANGLLHEAAHDALSDVRATIALARLIRERQPKLFDFCLKLHKKDAVLDEIGLIGSQGKPFLHISGMYGAQRGCTAVVFPLAQHPTNKNEVIVWDLAFDPSELASLSAQTIRERLFTKADELPEGTTRLPIKTIHINKSPIVIKNLKVLSPEMAQRWGIDLNQVQQHGALAAALPDLTAKWRAVFERDLAPIEDVDQNLYGGFVGNGDRRKLTELRGKTPEQLAQVKTSFDDARLSEVLFRYRARNFPDSLLPEEQEMWQEHRAARLMEGADGVTKIEDYFEQIDALSESADERGEQILGALYDYATEIAP